MKQDFSWIDLPAELAAKRLLGSELVSEIDGQKVVVKIVAIRKYRTFLEMAKIENYKLVIPSVASAESAAEVYNKYYSSDDQEKYGVLAIEIVPLTNPELAELAIQGP